MGGARPIDLKTSALIAIDMQRGFDAPGRPALSSNPDEPALRLLTAWRSAGGAVFIVRHDSLDPGSPFAPAHPGNVLRDGFAPAPGETLIAKSVNSAFIGTDLDLRLRRSGAQTLVMFGISTDMCLSTSVRMAANLGYGVIVASDACAAFEQPGLDGVTMPARQIHVMHLATLANEFAEVAPVAAVLRRMPRL